MGADGRPAGIGPGNGRGPGLGYCATNSPFASIVLSIEMFGSGNVHLFALVCVVCFVLSGHSGLYAAQVIQFRKTSTVLEEET